MASAQRDNVEVGALRFGSKTSSATSGIDQKGDFWRAVAFQASASSAVFGNSETIRVASFRLLAIIKA